MAKLHRESDHLQSELEKAKESLKDVDENIKKLTGRDPIEQRSSVRRVSVGAPMDFRARGPFGGAADRRDRRTRALSGPGGDRARPNLGGSGDIRGRLFALARQGIGESEATPPKRRIVGGAFSRLGPARRDAQSHDSGDEDDLPNKPTVQSSVVLSPGLVRTRKESIDQQNKDERGKARNKRMFGLILGTLQQFRTEAKETKEKDEQRRQIEVKLEDKAKQEKEDAQKERQLLFKERRDRQVKVQILEQKMERVNTHEEWERETKKLRKFLRTKAKPHLFYKPRSLDSSDARVKQTHKAIDSLLKERRKQLEEDLNELSRQLNKEEKGGETEDKEGEDEEGHEGEGLGQNIEGGGHDVKERTGKRADNKENVNRRGDRKRRKSPEEDEVVEEEEVVSVGVVETRTGENGEGGSDGGHGDEAQDTRMDGDDEDRGETTQDLSRKVMDDGKGGDESKGDKTRTETNDQSEVTDRDKGRRVVLAEDEDENGGEMMTDGDPEQADE